MQIDFTKLQKLFVLKIKNEENLILFGHDVSFKISPNYQFSPINLTVKILIFGEEFSIGYAKEKTTEEELINDFYSRLHDYNTDDAKNHIIILKIQELERSYSEQILILIQRITRILDIESDKIMIDISDFAPSENDNRGFPKFGIFVTINKNHVLTKEIGFNQYIFNLSDMIENEIIEKLKSGQVI